MKIWQSRGIYHTEVYLKRKCIWSLPEKFMKPGNKIDQGGNSIGFFDSPNLGDLAQSWVISPTLSPSSGDRQMKEREGGDHPTLGSVTQLWAVKKSNWIATLGDRLPERLLVAGREVDEAEVVGAGEADAAEPSRNVWIGFRLEGTNFPRLLKLFSGCLDYLTKVLVLPHEVITISGYFKNLVAPTAIRLAIDVLNLITWTT